LKLEKHWRVSLLTVLGVGPELVLNSASTPIQGLIQNSFNILSYGLFPNVISMISFALFVPFGPIFRHKLGARKNYIMAMCVFFFGTLISIASPNIIWMSIGRSLQGVGAGLVLMMMIPMLVLAFPLNKRDLALIVLTGGVFGSGILGSFLGALANIYGEWKWLFYLAAALSVLGMLLGCLILTNDRSDEHFSIDFSGFIFAGIVAILFALTLFQLQRSNLTWEYVWFGLLGTILFFILLFLIESKMKKPFLSFKLIMFPKLILSLFLIVLVNVAMIISMSSLQGILRSLTAISNKEVVLITLGILVGVVIAALTNFLFYDKLGPGYLAMLGSVIILAVNLIWTYLHGNIQVYIVACSFILLIAGVGITMISGLMGVALGGPLPDLVQRMTAVQFIRLGIGAGVPLVNGYFLNKVSLNNIANIDKLTGNIDKVELKEFFVMKINLSSYHQFFFISFLISLFLVYLSFGIILTGKGHKLAHKSHQVQAVQHKERALTSPVIRKRKINSLMVRKTHKHKFTSWLSDLFTSNW
jgi:predicted MFS family arabinose efflux permease